MELKNTIEEMSALLARIVDDLDKAANGNKAASQRVRTGTVKLEKIAKHYRKESSQEEKQTKGVKKDDKKPAAKGKGKVMTSKSNSSSTASAKAPAKAQKTVAKQKAFAVRKSTAKLPTSKG